MVSLNSPSGASAPGTRGEVEIRPESGINLIVISTLGVDVLSYGSLM